MDSVSGVGLCRWCSWRKERAVEVRASPSVSPERLHGRPGCGGRCPAGSGAGGGRVPGGARHPGRLYDLPPALPRPRATGNFQKPYIPRPPWVCEYLYLCVSVEVFRWLFPPERGLRGQAELGRVPHLFSAALWAWSLPPFAPASLLLRRFLAESGAWQRGCEWGSPEHPGTVHSHTAEDGRLLALGWH